MTCTSQSRSQGALGGAEIRAEGGREWLSMVSVGGHPRGGRLPAVWYMWLLDHFSSSIARVDGALAWCLEGLMGMSLRLHRLFRRCQHLETRARLGSAGSGLA